MFFVAAEAHLAPRSAALCLARRLNQLEARIEKKLATHDEAIGAMLSAIRELMAVPAHKRRGIGFTADLSEKS